MKSFMAMAMLLAASAVLTGCDSGQAPKAVPTQTMHARVVESRQEEIPAMVRTTGTLHARETATLSAQVMGRVERVLVREGDTVRAGQTLVLLDDASLRAAAEQSSAGVKAAEGQQLAAQTNADLAASTLARYKQLQLQKSVSPQELDEVSRRAEASAAQVEALRAQAAAAKAQQAGAQAMLAYTRVAAPFSGVVSARMVDPGALASPGVPLLQVESAGPLQLQTTVDESAISAVHRGMKVPLNVSGAPAVEGIVSEIVPAADPASHSFTIKIDVPGAKNLHAGMFGTGEIPTGVRLAILVPRSAVIQRGSLPCAYVLDSNGVAQLRYITLGAQHGNTVEILSGLQAGEKLVDDPADRDLAGKRIEAQS